jgi:hypothetical protein
MNQFLILALVAFSLILGFMIGMGVTIFLYNSNNFSW